MSAGHTGSGHAGSLLLPGLIPVWLGGAWAVVLAAVLIAHLRHVVMACPVLRRCWHWAHVLMAASMIVMYLPASLNPLHIPAGGWRAVFIVMLVVLVFTGVNEFVERRAVSGRWLLVAADTAAMLYMWSPGISAPLASLLIGGFLFAEAGAWACDRVAVLDRPLAPRVVLAGGSGVLGIAAGGSSARGATRDLRLSMTAMTLGMSYMVLAMALGT